MINSKNRLKIIILFKAPETYEAFYDNNPSLIKCEIIEDGKGTSCFDPKNFVAIYTTRSGVYLH